MADHDTHCWTTPEDVAMDTFTTGRMKRLHDLARDLELADRLPAGARLYPYKRYAVSEPFIDSLAADGVSEATIRAIRRDNAGRSPDG